MRNVSRNHRSTFLVFGSPTIEEQDIEEVVATLRSGWIGLGPKVKQFECAMAAYVGATNAIAVNSCTAALHLSLLALGIGAGDEVITTPMTFAATANTIIHTGARPVFADVNRTTMLIDPQEIESVITSRTKAILPVHLAGRPCPMDEIAMIARRHGLHIIADAAHCIEGQYKGRHIASCSDLTCFSFYVTKNITTAEGGMVITNNDVWAKRIRILSQHGMDRDAFTRFTDAGYRDYDVVAPGYKYNMTDLQASIGLHQLARIDASWHRRDQIWSRYDSGLSDLPIHCPPPVEHYSRHARHLYTPLVYESECGVNRDELARNLKRRQIGTGVHYRPLHLHDYYRRAFGFTDGTYPIANHAKWESPNTSKVLGRLLFQREDCLLQSLRLR